MVFEKMAAIFRDFKWSGLEISDPIQNQEPLPANFFLTIQNPEASIFLIPTM